MKKYGILLLLLSLFLGISGCASDRREELKEKLLQGEALIAMEKFEEAEAFFEALLVDNPDNITIMEKRDFSRELKLSREKLQEASDLLEDEQYIEAFAVLKEISKNDEGGLESKENLLQDIQGAYLTKAESLAGENRYAEALAELEEYLTFAGEDEKIMAALEDIKERKIAYETPPPEPPPVPKIIVIDPGHQLKGNYAKEPVGPGSAILKTKVSSGTQGRVTRVPEYVLNLQISVKLRDRLQAEGYTVILTRESHDVNLSNKERAEMANGAKADLFLRIHANGNDDPSVSGIMTIYPSLENPFVAALSPESLRLSTLLHDEMVKATGTKSGGIRAMDDLTGINWAQMPVSLVELGYMSNPEEDVLLSTPQYQDQLVEGLVRGIQRFFENLP